MNTSLPSKTEELVPLPNGDKVLVIVLNDYHKRAAETDAKRAAQRAVRRYMKGGEDYESVVFEVRELGADGQAQMLAGGEYFKIREAAESAHADPPEPQMGERENGGRGEGETASQFASRMAKWEKACLKAKADCDKAISDGFQAAIDKALRLTAKKREEDCCRLYVDREFWTAYSERVTLETLLRAVRGVRRSALGVGEDALIPDPSPVNGRREAGPVDRSARYFSEIAEVEDLDDEIRHWLVGTYERLTVQPAEIPTSPESS